MEVAATEEISGVLLRELLAGTGQTGHITEGSSQLSLTASLGSEPGVDLTWLLSSLAQP